MSRTDRTTDRLLLVEQDGVVQGGVEIAEVRDSDRAVILMMNVGVTATTGLHWHEKKTEFLQVLQGQALIRIGHETGVFGTEDGVITVPRNTIHEFGRADKDERGASSKDIDLRIKEWTGPPDGAKEVFFRNMIGVINDREPGMIGAVKVLSALFVVMAEHDNFPVILNGPAAFGSDFQSWIRRSTTYTVLSGVALVGRFFGLKGTYTEYTPKDLMEEL